MWKELSCQESTQVTFSDDLDLTRDSNAVVTTLVLLGIIGKNDTIPIVQGLGRISTHD